MWRAVYDSVKGTSHFESGLPCQDACRVITWPFLPSTRNSAETLIAVCADGAGSASHSHIGAQLACDAVITHAINALDLRGLQWAIERAEMAEWYSVALARIRDESSAIGVAPRELACTLLTAIISPTRAVFAQLGDGAIVFKNNDELAAAFWPQRGEYANTTNFLTSPGMEGLIDFCSIDGEVSDVALFSDGLERLILRFADRAVHGPFLAPLFAHLRNVEDVESLFEPLRQFLDSPAINERTDDDKTLILASRL